MKSPKYSHLAGLIFWSKYTTMKRGSMCLNLYALGVVRLRPDLPMIYVQIAEEDKNNYKSN